MSNTMNSIATRKNLTGMRPPPTGCGVGSMPHSYASSLARLKRRGPTSGAMATENSANSAARANSPTNGSHAESDIEVLRPSLPSCLPCRSWSPRSDRGRDSRHGVDDPVHRVATPRVGEVGQQFQHEPHQCGVREAVSGRDAHNVRISDQFHEPP